MRTERGAATLHVATSVARSQSRSQMASNVTDREIDDAVAVWRVVRAYEQAPQRSVRGCGSSLTLASIADLRCVFNINC